MSVLRGKKLSTPPAIVKRSLTAHRIGKINTNSSDEQHHSCRSARKVSAATERGLHLTHSLTNSILQNDQPSSSSPADCFAS